jgi:ferritin-like metal-binding protein YciE
LACPPSHLLAVDRITEEKGLTMSLKDVLIDELRDLYSAENQIVKALPKIAKATSSPELKTIFATHFEETKGHVERLKQVFQIIGKKPTGQHCSGMEGLVEEGKEAIEKDEEGSDKDACLIGAAARVEHYEIAGYTVAIAIAKALKETEIAGILNETLAEEKNASKLVMGASKAILKESASEEDAEEEEDDNAPKSAEEEESERKSEEDEAAAAPSLRGSRRK